jgi:hypothetical protein
MARNLRDDGGQLMLLAGIVITIAFILTALTLSQISSMEKQAASERASPIVGEWRFLHERLASNFKTAVGTETDANGFRDNVLPVVLATFRAIEGEKGYDLIIRLAAGPTFAPSELQLTSGANYNAVSANGRVTYSHAYDNVNDGLIHQTPCPGVSSPATCLGGVYVYVRLTDGTAVLEETVLFPLNQ